MDIRNAAPLALAGFFLAPGALAAETAEAETPTVIVTASPVIDTNAVDDFAVLTTRVTEAQIRNSGALDLAAALRMTPGVQISRYNEVGSYSGDQGGNAYIRGMGTSRPGSEVKTYVDDVPVYMGVWNHPLIDLLPLNGMASINVQKGPQPHVTGNDFAAMKLSTRRATNTGTEGEFNLSLGSFSTRVLQGRISGATDNSQFLLAGGRISSDGDRPNSDGELGNVIGRFDRKFGDHWTLGAGILVVDNKVGDPGDDRFPTSQGPIGPYSFSNGVARNHSSTTLLTLSAAHEHDDWSGRLTVYRNEGDNDLVNDSAWGTFASSFRMTGFRWSEEAAPWSGGQVRFGLERETIRGEVSGPHVGSPVGTPFGFGTAGTAAIPSFTLSSGQVAVAHTAALGNGWTLQPSIGVRLYDSNRYGSATSPHFGATLANGALQLRAEFARGVLYPGAETYALTRAIPMAFAANNGWDRLEPSRNQHRELGVQWHNDTGTNVDLSVFRDEVSGRYVWPGFFVSAILNPASGTWSNGYPDYRISGAEVTLQQRFGEKWALFLGGTTLDGSVDNLPYLPKTALALGITGQVGDYRLSFDAQHQSAMYSLTLDRGTSSPNRVSGFTVANVRVARAVPVFGDRGEVYVMLNNAFDADYAYNAGYPMAGRNFRLGLVASFR
jgi:outer membrane cobalamin receptor